MIYLDNLTSAPVLTLKVMSQSKWESRLPYFKNNLPTFQWYLPEKDSGGEKSGKFCRPFNSNSSRKLSSRNCLTRNKYYWGATSSFNSVR